MAEDCIAGFLDIKSHVYRRSMAFITVTFHAEHGRAIVATATRGTLFHLGHCHPLIIRSGAIGLVMTITAAVHGQMFVVIETGII